jgi:Mg-chelatase subunit ChlD
LKPWLRPVLWGLLAVVLVVMARVMLSACGISLFGFGLGFCQPATARSAGEVAILAQMVQDLELRLAGQQSCRPAGGQPTGRADELSVGGLVGQNGARPPEGRALQPQPTGAASGTPAVGGGQSDSAAPSIDGESTPPSPSEGHDGVEPGENDGPAPEAAVSEPQPDVRGEDSSSAPSELPSGQLSSVEEPSAASNEASAPSAEPASDDFDCPPQTEEQLRPPVVLALDRSKSMALPADIDASTVASLDELIASDDADAAWAAQMLYNDMVAQPGRKRLDDLKQSVAEATAERVPAALISFAGCTAGVQDHGSFLAEEREQFLAQVNGLRTTPATPLAEAIAAAADRARSLSSADARVLLVSDGLDTCGGDPCAAAANSGGIPIDVVAIGGQAPLACIAENSGGTMFSQSSGLSLSQLLSEALAPPTPSSEC